MLSEFALFEDIELVTLLPVFGLVLGLIFGAVAQRSRFCLRNAVVGSGSGLSPMAGAYAAALLVALIVVQALMGVGLLDLSDTRFVGESMPLGALLVGGALFGAGMVLTRGCASRLTVLAAQGNLRAVTVLLLFAVMAYAALRGILAAPRLAFIDATRIDVVAGALPLAGGVTLLLLLAAVIWRSGAKPRLLGAGALVGLLVAAGWFATGALLLDEFDPRPAESLAFTSGASDGLFFVMASTAIEPSFGAALVLGTLAGAFLAAAISRELRLESFESPEQTLRYFAGAALMGLGGVLAGGCTIGAGLTGVSTLAVAPMIALVAIICGAWATHRVVDACGEAALAAVPAE